MRISELKMLGICLLLCIETQGAVFNIRDFGALGNKTGNDAAAIQAAIDKCSKAGGGTVYCPAGDYLCGAIELKSNITLYLEQGATIWAGADPNSFHEVQTDGVLEGDYNAHLIFAKNQQYISIEGPGKINGQGTADLARRAGHDRDPMPKFRIGILYLEKCRYVTVRDIKVFFSDTWTLHFKQCQTVNVDGVTIHNNYWRTNADGIDINSCKDVRISNCSIFAGDDCICLKTVGGVPCENIVVTNCNLETVATAAKFGTASAGDFRDILFSSCTIRNSTVGIGLFIKDGATAERVAFENISITTLDEPNQAAEWLAAMIYPVFIDIERRTNTTPAGSVKDITFQNIHIQSDNGILLQGMPEAPIENLTCRNITLRINKPSDYSRRTKHTGGRSNPADRRKTIYARQPSYFTIACAKGLTLDNIRVLVADEPLKKYPRRLLSIHETSDAVVRNVSGTPVQTQPLIALNNCTDVLVTDCYAPSGTQTFLEINCDKTANISTIGNDLRNAQNGVIDKQTK